MIREVYMCTVCQKTYDTKQQAERCWRDCKEKVSLVGEKIKRIEQENKTMESLTSDINYSEKGWSFNADDCASFKTLKLIKNEGVTIRMIERFFNLEALKILKDDIVYELDINRTLDDNYYVLLITEIELHDERDKDVPPKSQKHGRMMGFTEWIHKEREKISQHSQMLDEMEQELK